MYSYYFYSGVFHQILNHLFPLNCLFLFFLSIRNSKAPFGRGISVEIRTGIGPFSSNFLHLVSSIIIEFKFWTQFYQFGFQCKNLPINFLDIEWRIIISNKRIGQKQKKGSSFLKFHYIYFVLCFFLCFLLFIFLSLLFLSPIFTLYF